MVKILIKRLNITKFFLFLFFEKKYNKVVTSGKQTEENEVFLINKIHSWL